MDEPSGGCGRVRLGKTSDGTLGDFRCLFRMALQWLNQGEQPILGARTFLKGDPCLKVLEIGGSELRQRNFGEQTERRKRLPLLVVSHDVRDFRLSPYEISGG